MPPKYFYYNKYKALGKLLFALVVFVLFAGVYIEKSNAAFRNISLAVAIFSLLQVVIFCIMSVAKDKPFLKVDKAGITDSKKWGFIEWDNVSNLKYLEDKEDGSSRMLIYLKDELKYEGYKRSWRIKDKIKITKFFANRAIISIDMNSFQENELAIFNSIEDYYNYYTGKTISN